MGTRPPSLIVISVLGILYAAMSGCGLLFSLVQLAGFSLSPNPLVDDLRANTGYVATTIITGGIGLILTAMLLAGSIGSLMLKPWAHKTMILYAWIAGVETIVSAFLSLFVLMPWIMKPAIDRTALRMPAGTTNMLETVFDGSICFSALLALVLPVLILIFYPKPKVRNAFQGFHEAGRSFAVEPPSPFA